jgi:hypothetical protein
MSRPLVNTGLAAQMANTEEELLDFEIAIREFVPNHGLNSTSLTTLNRQWNDAARDWANQQGTVPGHGQKIPKQTAKGTRYANALPRKLARTFVRSNFPNVQAKAAARYQAEVNQLQAQIALLQSQHQQSLVAAQDAQALMDPIDTDPVRIS